MHFTEDKVLKIPKRRFHEKQEFYRKAKNRAKNLYSFSPNNEGRGYENFSNTYCFFKTKADFLIVNLESCGVYENKIVKILAGRIIK
jgi:hypothetical protein